MDILKSTRASRTKQALRKAFEYIADNCNKKGRNAALLGTTTQQLSDLPIYWLNPLAEWTGLEPATPGVTGRYSNQLNYHSWQWRPYGDSNPGTHRERVMS